MLEKIKLALQDYRDTYEGSTKIWKEVRKDLHDNYRGSMFNEKLTEAQELYEETLKKARVDNYAVCISILDDFRNKVKGIISVPVSSEFLATLEAIRNMKNPSKEEIDAIVSPFKSNYVSYRTLCDVFKGNEAVTYDLVTYDEIMKYCEELEKLLYNCFYEYSVYDYQYRVLIEGTVLDDYDSEFTSFLKRFENVKEH